MKKQVGIEAAVYLLCMIVACLLNLAVSALLIKLVNLLIVVGYWEAAVIRLISGLLVGGAVLGLVVGWECYHSAEFHPASVFTSLLIAGAAHGLLCTVLMFYPFIAGGVRDLAGILTMGSHFSSADCIEEIYLWAYLCAFGIDFAFRAAVALVSGAVGKRMRIKSRETLLGGENASPVRQDSRKTR